MRNFFKVGDMVGEMVGEMRGEMVGEMGWRDRWRVADTTMAERCARRGAERTEPRVSMSDRDESRLTRLETRVTALLPELKSFSEPRIEVRPCLAQVAELLLRAGDVVLDAMEGEGVLRAVTSAGANACANTCAKTRVETRVENRVTRPRISVARLAD
jgi:hypothetical protein